MRGAVLVVVFVLFATAAWSYIAALTAPGSTSVGTRTVEWISDKVPGGRALVLYVEKLWYQSHAPSAGGPAPSALPTASTAVQSAGAASATVDPAGSKSSTATAAPIAKNLPAPPDIVPFAADPLADEGHWQVAGRLVNGLPAIRVAYLRPDSVHTSLVAGVMWLDMKLLKAELVPGTLVPATSSPWPGIHYSVPASAQADLAATFNSGFLLRDSHGGWYGQDRMVRPLVVGGASLVIFKDGSATVGQWGRDVVMGPNVAAVRQNLVLVVDQGEVTPNVSTDDYKIWGKTLGNTVMVWRSGVGVTKAGALVYVSGPGLSVVSLANVLQRAGAVRAMELDINSQWTSAYYYDPAPGSSQVVTPTKLVPNMVRKLNRFLVPDERDFIALFARTDASTP